MDSALLFRPIRELSFGLRRREISPVELTELSLERLETLGSKTNAVVRTLRDRALIEAREAERDITSGRYRGPLHGIPYGAKDLLATRGVPTTWGAAPYRDQVFDYDAAVIERLRTAGAVLVAKLSMVELAGGMGYDHADAAFNGPGLNPWNTSFWSGGSSSGPGSAVAAGLVSFAIGSETSGSILTPSAFCGVTGLRPTYGLVSRYGAMALAWTLDKLGPMARTTDDCALVLAAISGADPRDESSVKRRFEYTERAPSMKRPRLGVPKGCVEEVQPAVREQFERALAVLARTCDVTRGVEWPDLPWNESVSAIVAAEGATAFHELIESGRVHELRCPADRVNAYSKLMTPAVDYLQAMRARKPMKRAVAALFERFDAIVSPTRASVAYPANQKFADVYPGVKGGPPLIAAGNLCGLPALAMPSGFGENALPTSIALMGPAFSERALVELGKTFQAATDWHTKRPPAA
jgi:Asp-tRNA(Asn)/Glu-tRNA(Gln) amidotransferase A subunit family amidase